MSEYKYSLPVLFKKTATGAIQKWMIGVEGTTIVTIYGQVGGAIQTTRDLIKSGKNQGRKNETAAEEQATKEAFSRWEKKKKSGYVISIAAAKAGEVDEIIEGGASPMLAKVYQDYENKISGRVAIQPKLDGARMICVIGNRGEVSLWTRTRKRIYSMEHIEESVAELAYKRSWRNMVLDGEAYNHDLKNSFEKLMSAFRKDNPTPEAQKLEYHVYDVMSDECFSMRSKILGDINLYGGRHIWAVETHFVEGKDRIKEYYKKWVEMGYEGAMVRLLGEGYKNKRSGQLLKLKEFLDAEFIIIGVEEGRGKLAGHAGNFICKTKSGKEFGVKMSGETSFLKTIFDNQEEYIGQLLTVKYQGLTSDGIPRFPVGLRIREDI